MSESGCNCQNGVGGLDPPLRASAGASSELKVIILGESSVGKTCLVKRLSSMTFLDNTDVTYGAAYAPYTYQTGRGDIKMGIWDTAGSERFRSFICTYFRHAKAAVICYSLDDISSFEKIEYWVNTVRKHEEKCVIYICGTKADLITPKNRTVITTEMIDSIAQESKAAGVVRTSSKTGKNVEELFQMIGEDFIKAREESDIRQTDQTIIHLTDEDEKETQGVKERGTVRINHCQC